MARIIRATPDFIVTKAEESSLWLFALNCGARAITAASVRIGDLRYAENVLSINLKVTKGNTNWNHRV